MKQYVNEEQYSLEFKEILQLLINMNKFTENPSKISKRSNLTTDEFISAIKKMSIPTNRFLETSSTSLKSVDSTIIPKNLELFAMKHLNQKKQKIHPHNCFDIYYIYQGSATLYFEDQQKELSEGDICLIGPWSKYRIISNNEEDLILLIYIRNSSFDKFFFNALTEYDMISKFIRDIIYNKNKANYLLIKGKNIQGIEEIIQNIYIETNYIDTLSSSASIHWTHLLFILLVRNFHFEESYYTIDSDKDFYFYQILKYTTDHYTEISIKKLSKIFNYSESYISALFTKNINQTFSYFVTNLRLNKAKKLLLETKIPIFKISEQLGYESVDHFSRVFKKKINYSPSSYRKKFSSEKKV